MFNIKGHSTLLSLTVGIPIFLIIDSPFMYKYTPYAQELATLLVLLAFFRSFFKNSPRLRRVMIIGVFIGFTGEIIFSLLLHMYHYRLDNIPLWVGFGHSLIFTSVYKIIKTPFFIVNAKQIKNWSLLFISSYALVWLYFENDLFGFLTTLLFLLFISFAKKSQLFFIVMFLVVVYIELIGTTTGTWFWPQILMGYFNFIPSANPPSGIAVFYFLFDYVLLFIYLQRDPLLKKRYRKF